MASVVHAAGHIFDESLVKDIWKAARTHVTDKAAIVSAAAFTVFTSLVRHRAHFKTSSDFEHFKALYLKALDSPSSLVRQSAAKCFAFALIELATASEIQQEAQPIGKRTDEGESERSSPAPSKAKTVFAINFTDSLKLFQASYTHATSSTRVRIGLMQTLAFYLTSNDNSVIEARFFEIAHLMLVDILSSLNIVSNKHKFILARSHALFIIKDVIASQLMEEFGQTSAIKVLTNEILKNYPAVLNEQVEPSPFTLVGTIECVEGILGLVKSAIGPHSSMLTTSLLQLLVHPVYSVQVAACSCIRTLVLLTPSQIIPLLNKGISSINDGMQQLSAKHATSPAIVGHARMVAILISLTYTKPQHSSIDIASRILSMATSLLKANGDVDVFTSTVQVQVAWLLISGLMPLGPNFVKVHLSQLLLLWKTALPKTMSKEKFTERSTLELCYLYHVRHCAVGALVSFLSSNSKLITPDVARRAIALLSNTTLFMSAINPKQFLDDDPSHLLDRTITLQDYDYMLKRRILQCYVYLSQYAHTLDAFPANVLPSALATFADPEKFTSLNLSTAIAAHAGTIDSVWQLADNFAFGITTKINGFDLTDVQLDKTNKRLRRNSIMEPIKDVQDKHWLSETDWIDTLEKQVNTPILASYEQEADSLLHIQEDGHLYVTPTPAPCAVTNLSMELFSTLFPSQTSKIQESLLVQLNKYIGNNTPLPTTGRPCVVIINSVVAIHNLLRFTLSSDVVNREHIKSPRVLSALTQTLKSILRSPDEYVRNVAAQSLGMLCSVMSSSSMAAEVIKGLIDEIVEDRDPNARGGCSIALAYILKHVGGMFAGLHLKTVLGIFVSLATDPHPTVHFWALEAISITISSGGLNFANYASNSLATLSKLYLLESHGDEVSSIASSNLEVQYSSHRIIARCVHALIDILGPDLQESSKSRSIVLTLLQQFQLEGDYMSTVESIRSLQELIIFVPDMVDIKQFAKPLSKYLNISYPTPLRDAAIDGLYQLIRTHFVDLFAIVGQDLKLDIWLAYNLTPQNLAIRKFIQGWLEQTATSEPLEWIARIQMVLFKSSKNFRPEDSKSKNVVESNLADEEVEGFANANESGEKSSDASFDEPLKWQTRALAVEMLRELIRLNLKGKSHDEVVRSPLVFKVGEIIRVAFTASTSAVIELRLLGVQLLNDVLTTLQDIEDPDFKEVALLEQYQAQIGSALTPAFTGDTSPELAAQAIRVCATFIGIGIIKNVDRMGRILKLLTLALESCSAKTITLGDLNALSPNAQVMLRMAVLSSWAELQVASLTQAYLIDVVKPYINILVPLWLSSLREFAQLRFEPEQSSGLSLAGSSIDHMYSALSRNSVLPFYQRSWLQLVDAIASLIEVDRKLVFDIMDEKERAIANSEKDDIKYSNEPAAFFFVLFGICFESLIRPQQTLGDESQPERRVQILTALKRILHPSVSGNAVYKDMVFVETVDVLDRIVLTGTIGEQQAVVDIAHLLCIHHPGNVSNNAATDLEDGLSENVDQLFELVRVVMLVLTTQFPYLSDSGRTANPITHTGAQPVRLVRTSLDYLVDMVEVFPHIIRVDLYACLLYVFGKILENSQSISLSKLSLIPLKKLLSNMTRTWDDNPDLQESIETTINTATNHFVSMLKTEKELLTREVSLLVIVILFNTSSKIMKPESTYVDELGGLLVESLSDSEFQTIAVECIRALLVSSFKTEVGKALCVKTIPQMISLATEDGYLFSEKSETSNKKINMVPKLVIDILMSFTKTLEAVQLDALLAITIPLLLWFSDEENSEIPVEQRKLFVNQKLLELVAYNSEAFKALLQNGLSEWQREMVEYIMLAGRNNEGVQETLETEVNPETHIQLKSFA